MSNVYVPDAVWQVTELHKELLIDYPGEWSVRFVLDKQALRLKEAYDEEDSAVQVQLSNWHPQCIQLSFNQMLNQKLTLDDMRLVVAREHGFKEWEEVLSLGPVLLDEAFETGVECMLEGDLKNLEAILKKDPQLTHRASKYAHHATMLHYLAANGVETWRQRVPANASDVARLLIQYGADVNATASFYGGNYTTLELLLTSAHPAAAGIADDLADVLRSSN